MYLPLTSLLWRAWYIFVLRSPSAVHTGDGPGVRNLNSPRGAALHGLGRGGCAAMMVYGAVCHPPPVVLRCVLGRGLALAGTRLLNAPAASCT